jgi:hypothetical protein
MIQTPALNKMTKNIFFHESTCRATRWALACSSILLTSCALISYPDPDAAPPPCSDPLAYYNELPAQIDDKASKSEATGKTKTSGLPAKYGSEACYKLHEAIKFSIPKSKQQNDKRALVLLKELKQSKELSEKDQQFNNMLLQHVSQRQELRNMIGSQDELLKKTETQIDQLQNIELEIDKKERSVTSPIDE